MKRHFDNIEKSAFRRREYVGYAKGVGHIRRTNKMLRTGKGGMGWTAEYQNGTYVICAMTLGAISRRLDVFAAMHV